MRKMPVLTMVSLVLLGVAVVPSYAATTAANDTPDIVLQAGETVSFDLADFFSSADASALTFTAEGATISGSVVTVDGSSSTATFTAGGVSVDSKVVVSSFIIGNGPAVDDNNRIVGQSGGNIFYNALVPGGVIKSVKNLTNLPAVGGGTTSSGQTAVALLTSVASIEGTVSDSYLYQVTRTVSTDSGLTPVLNEDGSYTVTASSDFEGTWLVTLGATDGDSADAVHLLAAEAEAVSVSSFTAMQAGTLTQATLSNGVVTANASEGVLAYGSPIEVGSAGDVVTLVADYTATADANIALVLFDGALGGNLAYCNPKSPNIAIGTAKNLSMSMITYTGTVIPAFQVTAGSAATTVTITNMAVVKAGPVTNYSLDPNACAFVDDLSSVSAWAAISSTDIAPTTDTDNNFTYTSASGCMKLAATSGVSNALTQVSLPGGTASAECYAKVSSGTGTFALGLLDGAGLSSITFVGGLGSEWSKVIAVATPAAAQTAYLVAQAASFDALVDDICIVVVEDDESFADLSLLGL